ncbi:MAG: ATP phosphoribosyltransferase regulatory subunit [Synergistaceae bacterium]|jgi:ATP phosphoribosyltransferase regulatory subunit|nr:ATP phosphoribosyltransferase regulatory subunit [Synergistaceae bacterium]
MIDNGLRTPEGFKDYLPGEYFFKKQIEDGLESVFRRYGYSSVGTPLLEYVEVFADKGSVDPRQIYRLIDREGNTLALRSDVTPPVARIAASNFSGSDMPLRFCYVENVYRYSPSYQGRNNEITQAGIELIGAGGYEADAETLAVAIDALLSSGLDDFRIDVGHVRFLNDVLEESGLDPAVCGELNSSVIARDFVAAERIGRENNVPENVSRLMSNLPIFSGGTDMLDEALSETEGESPRAALMNLKNIHSVLSDYGFEKYVLFDLSMAGNMDYYTGMIFRGYTSGMGFSILDGGRYDGLLSRFGEPYPSVGFIIKVHNLEGALEKQNGLSNSAGADVLVAWDEKGRNAALAEASRLRRDGLRVECSFMGSDTEANLDFARRRGIKKLYCFDGRGRKTFDAAGER